jgi:hypothetical protein
MGGQQSKSSSDWHVLLLGDSTIDNKGYVGKEGFSVLEHFQKLLNPGKVSMYAKDGALIEAVSGQLDRGVESSVTHIVVSVGGNNLIYKSTVIKEKCESISDGLIRLENEISKEFEEKYEEIIQRVLKENRPVMICAVYHPDFARKNVTTLDQVAANTAMRIFHDLLFSIARKYHLPVVDLRSVISEESDYANPIELAHNGGEKLAKAVIQAIKDHPFEKQVSIIYPQ